MLMHAVSAGPVGGPGGGGGGGGVGGAYGPPAHTGSVGMVAHDGSDGLVGKLKVPFGEHFGALGCCLQRGSLGLVGLGLGVCSGTGPIPVLPNVALADTVAPAAAIPATATPRAILAITLRTFEPIAQPIDRQLTYRSLNRGTTGCRTGAKLEDVVEIRTAD